MTSLPLELEYLIFKLAAIEDTDHDHRFQLSLVAKRVYEWIRPIIYRVAIARAPINAPISIPAWRNAQIANVAQFARDLLIAVYDSKQVLELLAAFRNVENLAIWQGIKITSQIISSLNGLPLRMLSADLSSMPLEELILQGSEAFGNLTHLEILDWEGSTKDCKALETLPKLTHLCFDLDAYVDQEVIDDLLMHCPLLRVLICATGGGIFADGESRPVTKSDDTRFVILEDGMSMGQSIDEWERSTNGRLGLWELAETIVEARNKKLFEDNSLDRFSREDWREGLNDDGMRWLEAGGGAVKFNFSEYHQPLGV